MLIPVWTLPLRHNISSSLGVARPFTNGLNGDGKNVQTLWWAELDQVHSMTRAHPPLHETLGFLRSSHVIINIFTIVGP